MIGRRIEMARKTWTQEEVTTLEQCIVDKVQRGETLTAGEDTLFGAIKTGKHLSVRLVEDIDHMMGIEKSEV